MADRRNDAVRATSHNLHVFSAVVQPNFCGQAHGLRMVVDEDGGDAHGGPLMGYGARVSRRDLRDATRPQNETWLLGSVGGWAYGKT